MSTRTYYLRNEQKVVFDPKTGDYFLAPRGTPIICLVSERDCDKGTIKYGYAILNPSEDVAAFSKAEGRRIATEKLESEPLVIESKAKTGHEINRCLIKHFSDTVGKKNGQAKKLAHRWLKVAAVKSTPKPEAPTP